MDNNDGIVYQARLHWIIFAWPFLILVAVSVIGYLFVAAQQISLLVGALAILWGISIYVMYRVSSITVTQRQVMLRKGLLTRYLMDIPLNKIASVNIQQSIFGTILGYGDIEISDTGGSREVMRYVSKPLTCRRYIEQILHGQP